MRVIRVAVGGLGAIGRVVARGLFAGMPGFVLACAAVRDHAKAQAWLHAERITCPLVEPAEFPARADLAIECTPAPMLERICRPMLEAGKKVMVLSVGALLPRPELIELAKARGGQIIVPSGALLGLDAVTAAAEGRIHAVRMITRKPPRSLMGAPYLVENGISLEGLSEPSATATPSRWKAIRLASPSRLRTSLRTIPAPAASRRFRCLPPCANFSPRCELELELSPCKRAKRSIALASAAFRFSRSACKCLNLLENFKMERVPIGHNLSRNGRKHARRRCTDKGRPLAISVAEA